MIVKVKGHTIELFDNIQNLPILRFQKFNKYMMKASEIGNNFEDYDQRTSKALAFLHKDMVKEAIQELSNRRLTVYNAYNEYSPRDHAFAIMIKKIDDVKYNVLSDDEIDKVLKHLNRIGLSHINSIEKLNEVKKKSNYNLISIFQKILKTITKKIKIT